MFTFLSHVDGCSRTNFRFLLKIQNDIWAPLITKMPAAPKEPGVVKNTINFLFSFYHDPFRCFGLFGLGVRIARECIGLDITAPAPAPAALM
ncbi:hypothetical protein B566_EDAN012937 [Ephemera danica]|nr:hypothetical protein B566_EDAN012937 [Ephemera danica]